MAYICNEFTEDEYLLSVKGLGSKLVLALSPRLESGFLKQLIHIFEIFACLRCLSYRKKTPHNKDRPTCNVYTTSLKISSVQTLTSLTGTLLNVGNLNQHKIEFIAHFNFKTNLCFN